LNVLQSDIDKSDSSVRVGCVWEDEQPVKRRRVEAEVRPTKIPPVNVDDGNAKAADGEHLSFFADLTACDDSELLPQTLTLDERLSNSKDLPESPSKSRESCATEDNVSCVKPLQLLLHSGTVSPPESPVSPANPDLGSREQSVNGVWDVTALKIQYRNAVTAGHCDGVTDEPVNNCHDDVVQTNGFPELEIPQVTGVVVNGGNIAHDFSC